MFKSLLENCVSYKGREGGWKMGKLKWRHLWITLASGGFVLTRSSTKEGGSKLSYACKKIKLISRNSCNKLLCLFCLFNRKLGAAALVQSNLVLVKFLEFIKSSLYPGYSPSRGYFLCTINVLVHKKFTKTLLDFLSSKRTLSRIGKGYSHKQLWP